MLKLWVRYLTFALLFVSLALFPFQLGVQASPSLEQTESDLTLLRTEDHQPALPPGFQIISTTRDSLVIDIQSPSYSFETVQTDDLSCETLKADGYAQSANPGEPGLLSAGVLLGIPLNTDPAVRILSIETVELPKQVHLCPVGTPQIASKVSGDVAYQGDILTESALAYSQDAFLPAQPVELEPSGMLRSQVVAQLRYMPFQYNSARNELRLIRHIRLEIQLGSDAVVSNASTPVDEGVFESLLMKILINYDQARYWRAQPEHVVPVIPSPYVPQDEPVYKIQVNQDGLYQVTYAALQSAGVPVSTLNTLDPHTFSVLNQGVEIPVFVSGEGDGVFNTGDYLLFYGQKINTRFTDINIYWLSWGAGNGLRMAALNGAAGGAATPDSFKTTLHLEENHYYMINDSSGPERDHWYWNFLDASSAPDTKNYTFQLQNLGSSALTANVRGLLKGVYAAPQHHTRVWLNGHNDPLDDQFDDQTWPSTSEYAFAFDIPQSYLIEGTNTLTVECPRDGGISVDQVLSNWFEIDYYHSYTAENNLLAFSSDQSGLREFHVGGFSSSAIDVFDISNPLAPARIVGGSILLNGSLYQVNFEQLNSEARRYLALSPSRWLTPVAINLDVPSNLRSLTNGADYIIISYPDFLDAIQPLAAYRATQGLRVKVVDVQDVYDEFNGGVFDPQAIQSFLAYAYSHWATPAPAYVLLVGDGHYDLKDYYGGSGTNYIPPFLGNYDTWLGETAADNRYVTISGSDTLPDMYIGRFPVNSAAETSAMVSKIIAYETDPLQGDWNTRLTFVADNADSGGNFPVLSDDIADHYLRPEFSVEKIYYGVTHTTTDGAKAAIIAAINQGRLIVHYTGHAGTVAWASERLLQVTNISSLTNAGMYPFFLPMTCAEGYFINPKAQGYNFPSLAESLVRASGKGAIASFSPTSYGLSSGHDFLAQGLYHAIFSDGTTQLGPATAFAKVYLNANSTGFLDLLDTYMLFGDPASRLRTNPTAVLLDSFTGQGLTGAIQLDWETSNEVGLVGFNIYRSQTIDGVRQLLNSSLIPANHRGQMIGDVYQFIDPLGPGEHYFYWLELVQIGGSDLTAPIDVTSGYWLSLPMTRK